MFASSAPGNPLPLPRNTRGSIPDIGRDVAKTRAMTSELHAMVCNVLENQEGAGGQDRSVSVIWALFITELALNTTLSRLKTGQLSQLPRDPAAHTRI